MSSKYSIINDKQDLIYALQSLAPENPLVKLVIGHNEALRNLAEIFIKCIPPVVPPRMLVREVVREKLKEVN